MKRLTCRSGLLLLSLVLLGAQVRAGETVRILESRSVAVADSPMDVALSPGGRRMFVLTESREIQIYDGAGVSEGRIPVASSVQGILSGPNDETLLLVHGEEKRVELVLLGFVQQIPTEGSPRIGPENAPVEIVVFSEFPCPNCAHQAPLLQKMATDYPEDVTVVFKHFPLRNHSTAVAAAAASEAARLQGKFWEMHDLLFQNQNRLNKSKIREIAKEIGLDMDRFARDLRDPDLLARVREDASDGTRAGVRGVPSVYVNGLIMRDRREDALRARIEAERTTAAAGTQEDSASQGPEKP